MATSAPHERLHLVALDVEAASSVCSLPGVDHGQIRAWESVEAFASWAASDEADDEPRIRVAVAVATADEIDVQGLRSLQVLPRRIDVLVVARHLDPSEHANLLKTGIGRVEHFPLPPLGPEVLFADRAFLSSLFPGEIKGTRRDRIELEVTSCRENVPAVVRLLCERCDEFGHPNDFVRSQLPLVIDEAVSNAMKHGHDWDASKSVKIVASIGADGIELKITDQGEGFARDEVHDPLHADRRGRSGGRGLFLIEAMMDDVHYEDGGRTIVLDKRLGTPIPAV